MLVSGFKELVFILSGSQTIAAAEQTIAEPVAMVITIATASASAKSDREVLGPIYIYSLILNVILPGRKVRPIVRSCSRAGIPCWP